MNEDLTWKIEQPPKQVIKWYIFGSTDICICLTEKPSWLARKTITFFLGSKWEDIK
jgi:hypothetical protein